MNIKVIPAPTIALLLAPLLALGTSGCFGDDSPVEPSVTMTTESEVVINGRTLTPLQIEEFQALYGIAPTPGDYWYDARSGLYGVAGMAPAGFMLPGHEFGPLAANASGGSTAVFVNGRNIPQDELMVLNAIWNSYVQPGRYWLDAFGNVGYEGAEYPVANLLLQIQAMARAGGGGAGGGNIWSSRYGAGNSNADNSAGYVSVPGHGPIGYGN